MATSDLEAGDGAVWLGLSRCGCGGWVDPYGVDRVWDAKGAYMTEIFRGCNDDCFHCTYSDCLKGSSHVQGVYNIVLPGRVPYVEVRKKTPSIAATVGCVRNKTVKEIIS